MISINIIILNLTLRMLSNLYISFTLVIKYSTIQYYENINKGFIINTT